MQLPKVLNLLIALIHNCDFSEQESLNEIHSKFILTTTFLLEYSPICTLELSQVNKVFTPNKQKWRKLRRDPGNSPLKNVKKTLN